MQTEQCNILVNSDTQHTACSYSQLWILCNLNCHTCTVQVWQYLNFRSRKTRSQSITNQVLGELVCS